MCNWFDSGLGHIYITLTWGFEERVVRVPATSQVTDMGVQVPLGVLP